MALNYKKVLLQSEGPTSNPWTRNSWRVIIRDQGSIFLYQLMVTFIIRSLLIMKLILPNIRSLEQREDTSVRSIILGKTLLTE